MPSRALAFALLTFGALAQQPAPEYPNLKAALNLSAVQVNQLYRVKANAHPPAQRPQGAGLVYSYRNIPGALPWLEEEDAARKAALSILTEDQRNSLAALAVTLRHQNGAMQLVSVGAISCGQWPGVCACFYAIQRDDTGLGLTPSQLEQFEALRQARLATKDAAASPELAMQILDAVQQSKLAAFQSDLRVLNEAIAIGLLPRQGGGEPLCN